MTVAINMRMKWSWMLKDDLFIGETIGYEISAMIRYHKVLTKRSFRTYLGSFHRIMLRELNLKLVSFIGIKSSRSSMHFNDPSGHTNSSSLHHRLSIKSKERRKWIYTVEDYQRLCA